MDRPSKAMLARMPLAEAVLLLWRWVTNEQRMQNLWDGHRGRCYQKVISFPLMVHLIADALLKYNGSGRRAFEESIDNEELEATIQAAFKKLGRLPVALSQAFLSHCTAALREAFPEWAEWQAPKSLRHFHIMILDGKAIKRVAKRLKPLRGVPGGLLGGRTLVALDWRTGMAVAMHAHEDGDANDVRFTGDLIPKIREHVEGPRLWMADSAFCDLTQPEHFTAEDGDHFLVRYHPKTPFFRDPQRKQRKGKDERGRSYIETWGYLGSESNKRRRYVRRIEVQREDAKPLILITDLLDAEAYPAEDLLWLYAERWGIEQVFQKVTEVFGLKRLIGSSPKACIFQFAFCLLLYNLIQVVRGYLAEAHDEEPDAISTEKLFEDVEQQLIAWNVMFEPDATMGYFALPPELPELRARLVELLGSSWRERWRKSPPQERHEKTPKKNARTHNSVYRILKKHTRKKKKRPARAT
jgi:hypothetical protein